MLSQRFKYSENNSSTFSLSDLQQKSRNEIKNKIKTGEYTFVATTCPCESGKDDADLSDTERYNLNLHTVLCKNCGTLRFDPYLSPDSVSDFYIHHYQQMYGRSMNVDEYFERQKSYGERIFQSYDFLKKKKSRVLEIGCGAGGALSIFLKEGHEPVGCEYSENLVEEGKKRGLNLYQGDLKMIYEHVKNQRFDLIYMHHVFEHVDDPLVLINLCKTILSENGLILIGVPDAENIDKKDNPGGNLMAFLHIAHKYNYTLDCFISLAAQAGLACKKAVLNPAYSTPWAVQPELWVEMTNVSQVDLQAHLDKLNKQKPGEAILRHLQKVETDYQLKPKLSPKKSLLKKILEKLSGS